MTEEQLKMVIMNAHMAGQHDAGIDSSTYEALVYYKSLVKNLTIPLVMDSVCEHSWVNTGIAIQGKIIDKCKKCGVHSN